MSDIQMEVDDGDQVGSSPETPPPPPPEDKPLDQPKGKAKAKPAVALVRESGKSLLPISRVQKIMKADKELPIVAKEATFLISLATEEFIKRFSEASYHIAHREKRVTVQQRDIASVARRADEFLFLEGMEALFSGFDATMQRRILEIMTLPDDAPDPARRKPQALGKSKTSDTSGNRSISDFVTSREVE